MLSLAERLAGMEAAILDPTLAPPPGLVGPDGEPSLRRFSVYRNNVVVGLSEALRASFPAVCRLVGQEFFDAMARAYVVHKPPTSPILLDYGSGFAEFISGFGPTAEIPYLADVARIERAWLEAYHELETLPLQPDALVDIPADRIAGIRLSLHPSLRIVRSAYPALTIWQMNVDGGMPAPVDLAGNAEDALILRPEAEVQVRAMPVGGAAFVMALREGHTLGVAAMEAFLVDPKFALSGNIRALVQAGAFTALQLDNESPRQDGSLA